MSRINPETLSLIGFSLHTSPSGITVESRVYLDPSESILGCRERREEITTRPDGSGTIRWGKIPTTKDGAFEGFSRKADNLESGGFTLNVKVWVDRPMWGKNPDQAPEWVKTRMVGKTPESGEMPEAA